MAKKTLKERPVVVCTENGGVHFGYATDTSGSSVFLRRARNAFYWKCSAGIAELGATGPQEGSKIGAVCDVTLERKARVYECTPAAVEAWEKASWAK